LKRRCVVEISRNGDDSLGPRLAEIIFRGLLHLLQHEGGDFRWRVLLVAALDPERRRSDTGYSWNRGGIPLLGDRVVMGRPMRPGGIIVHPDW